MTVVTTDRAATSEKGRHIARTAARLFATRGYDATSVREIVEAAGVTKPTLYHYFGSKEGLAQALLHVPLRALAETLREIAVSEGDLIAVLVNLIEAHLVFCREEPDRARLYYAICFGPLNGNLAEELATFGSLLREPMTTSIRRLADAGIVSTSRVDDFEWACRGLITSAVMDHLYKGRELEPGLSGRLVGDLLKGFGERGTSRRKS